MELLFQLDRASLSFHYRRSISFLGSKAQKEDEPAPCTESYVGNKPSLIFRSIHNSMTYQE